ncbi:MAG: glycosyltransferase [bacterium]|nr:glycosyltransferase [bacterium]
MAERMRVLLLADVASFHTERYAAELRRQGCFVLIASLENGRITYHQLRKRGPFSSLHYVLASTEVNAVIKRFQPDIINPHYVSGYGFTAALAGAKKYAPIVTHIWGSDILVVPKKSIFHRRKTAYALGDADLIIGDSDHLVAEAERVMPMKRAIVVPWGIERKYLSFHKSDYHRGRPLRILVPRMHGRVYNNQFIVKALAPLVQAGEVELTFPSFGPDAGLFRLLADKSFNSGIKYYDRLERSDLMKLFAAHDVYLSAASTDSSPVSLIEAMGIGLVPVAPNIPGVKEWLGVGHGFVYDLFNEEMLREKIRGIIFSKNDFDEMRRSNLERIKKTAVFEENIGRVVAEMRALVRKK